MKKIKILGIIFAALILFVCAGEVSAKDVSFSQLSNFFVKNNVELQNSENYFVVKSQKEFSNIFGIARTMGNTVEQVDFSKYFVVAVVSNATNRETSIKINSVTEKNGNLNIKYSIKRARKLSYTSTPFMAVKISRGNYANITFSKGIFKKSIPFGN